MNERRQESYAIRLEAAELARSRAYPAQKANGDEQKYAGEKYFMSFTKGLPHESETGLLHKPQDFVELRRAIDDGFIDTFSDRVRQGSRVEVNNGTEKQITKPGAFRQWEAPTAGVVYELQGADAQAVTMPPAPPLLNVRGAANPELVLEMAEVYELAILRDVEFNNFELGGVDTSEVQGSIDRLNTQPYIGNQFGRPRKVEPDGKLSLQTVFRGSAPGVEVGPYLSQFLLLGTNDRNGKGGVAQGKIGYGVLQIDQKVPIAVPGKDFMTNRCDYVSVQRGLEQVPEAYCEDEQGLTLRRFISTPRDLATYVHYDALYQAYLNACIILLEMKTPFDPAFDHLSGGGVASVNTTTRRNAGGFALFGGPHILNLVTEVATRALKAVRFQKFNNHLRLRPEALAATIELLRNPSEVAKNLTPPGLTRDVGKFKGCLEDTLKAIAPFADNSHFLPMAFPEGSPMHPSYGAGHAAVAGACVTMLKAFFDTSAVLAQIGNQVAFKRLEMKDKCSDVEDRPVAYRAPAVIANPTKSDSRELDRDDSLTEFLTLEGELNKLAANISIGRNMAGVHFFSDYYDSLRLGEEIAIAVLEEQALTYATDPFVLSLPTFDGEIIRIGRR
ncbi:MAG: bromoperoxidase [Cyanobacteria bacterium J06643_13]